MENLEKTLAEILETVKSKNMAFYPTGTEWSVRQTLSQSPAAELALGVMYAIFTAFKGTAEEKLGLNARLWWSNPPPEGNFLTLEIDGENFHAQMPIRFSQDYVLMQTYQSNVPQVPIILTANILHQDYIAALRSLDVIPQQLLTL